MRSDSSTNLLGTLALAAALLLAPRSAAAADKPKPEPKPVVAVAPITSEYQHEIEAWQKERDKGLRDENSWLTVAGLFWLDEGENRFGSDAGNKVILPEGKAPAVAGTLVRHGKTVTVQPAPGVAGLTADDQPLTAARELTVDADGKPTMLKLGSLTFFVIQRGDKVGVRVKDSESPALAAFHGLDFFPVQAAWRVEARFEPSKGKKIPIANILGQVSDEDSPGAVVFDWQGKTYRLDALSGGDDGSLFLLFADQTNGKDTYGAGRFLDTPAPKDGKVVVDFNTAYNPPCAFTAFATCPLPPAQNHLPLRVEAGEKKFGAGHAAAH
jgi:uncharacterized protein (DUF1684 family)